MTVRVVTMGFAPSRILDAGISNFYRTHDPALEIQHYLVDQHYPLNRKSNLEKISELATVYNLTVLDPGKDLGLHHGFNWALKQIQPAEDDIILTFDPDSGPTNFNWDSALVRVLKSDFSIAGLMNPRTRIELCERGHSIEYVGETEVWVPRCPVVLSVAGWRYDFLKKVGGFSEPTNYYGHLESAMWAKSEPIGVRWGYLPHYGEEDSLRHRQDVEYRNWKWLHAHRGSFTASFGEYVDAGCPIPADCPELLP